MAVANLCPWYEHEFYEGLAAIVFNSIIQSAQLYIKLFVLKCGNFVLYELLAALTALVLHPSPCSVSSLPVLQNYLGPEFSFIVRLHFTCWWISSSNLFRHNGFNLSRADHYPRRDLRLRQQGHERHRSHHRWFLYHLLSFRWDRWDLTYQK